MKVRGTLLLLSLGLSSCAGAGQVRFDRDTCYIDGQRAGLQAVEEREAAVQHRISSRQPWLVAITVVVVGLAGISYGERLLLMFSVSGDAKSMSERVKAIAMRYREHPIRYFSMVLGSVGLLLTAGILYIYLDADKRTSERALGTLQFCHLALRTAEEKKTLDDQRQNLASIHDTAGEIRRLIDKLPPAEQVKAQEIIGHMDDAVGRQGRFLADHLRRSADATESIRDGTLTIERGIGGLEAAVGNLKDLPAAIRALSDGLRTVDARGGATEHALVDMATRLTSLQQSVDTLASRPVPSCPACVCNDRPSLVSAAGGPDGGAN